MLLVDGVVQLPLGVDDDAADDTATVVDSCVGDPGSAVVAGDLGSAATSGTAGDPDPTVFGTMRLGFAVGVVEIQERLAGEHECALIIMHHGMQH